MTLRILALVTILLIAGCSTAGAPADPTPTPSPHVVDRNVTSGAVTLEGLPIDQTFQFQIGPSAPTSWEFPIRVEFQRVYLGNWTETYVFRVNESEPITVELVAREHYRIVVQDANNERRVMGLFVPAVPGKEMTVIIGPCCVDDFSTTSY